MRYEDNAESRVFTFKLHSKLTTETLIEIFLHLLPHEDNLYNVKFWLMSRKLLLRNSEI